jgi:LmbE family N-acetylglucosaminyl deacetylase
MRRVAAMLVLASTCALAQRPHRRVMLAVFGHPDDESLSGPVLARYAREGAKVYLAIATKGEKGTNERAGIPAGEPLAKVRRAEAECSCRELGIEAPIFLEANDGELGAITNPIGRNVERLADKLAEVIGNMKPDVVITGGPEGGDGHPDHRLTADAVVQVIEALPPGIRFYYGGFSPAQAEPLAKIWDTWHPTDPFYLTVRVAVSKEDQKANRRAIECHKSQFSQEEAQKYADALDMAWREGVWFQPWFGEHKSDDLFK